MDNNTKAAVAATGIIVAGAAGYAIYKTLGRVTPPGGNTFLLQILAGAGGTTNPSPSPSGILEDAGKVITITATPNSGYTVGSWLVDGQDAGSSSSLTVTMNMDHNVIVTFWQGGQPPPSAPYAIVSPTSQLITGYYGCIVTLGALNSLSKVSVGYADANWNVGGIADVPLTFKVIDANGKGVPNITVTIYPNLTPDTSKYKGIIILNDQRLSPINVITDSNGNATVNVSYFYGLNDHLRMLCQDAQLYLWVSLLPFGVPEGITVEDGVIGNVAEIFVEKGGDKIVPATPTLNSIIAEIPGTAIPQAQVLVYCQFHAKML